MRLDPARIPLLILSRRAVKARLLLAVASGLALLMSAGCAGSSTSTAGAVSSTVTIAAVPGIANAPVYLAKKDGLFAAAGLTNVVIKSYSTEGAVFAALQNGQADIAASDYGDIFYQQAQSPDLKILADGYDAGTGVLEILTMPHSSITSPADLAGAQVGVPSYDNLPSLDGSTYPVSLEAAAASQVLQTYIGNDAFSVQWDPMSQQQEVTLLEDHQLKAILVGEPYIYEAQSQAGAVEVLDACSGSTADLPISGYVATKTWVKDNPAAVADFQSGLAKAQGEGAMFGPVQNILPSFAAMTVQDADLATIGSYPTSTSAIELERVERLMVDNYMMKIPSAAWKGAVPPMVVGS